MREPLPPGSRSNRLYCNKRCRQRFRLRHQTREERERLNAYERERQKKRRQLAHEGRLPKAPTHCLGCGEPLPPPSKYKPKLYCNARCKPRPPRNRSAERRWMAEEHKRRRKQRQNVREQRRGEAHTHCVECGEPLPPLHTYAPERRHCGHRCREAAKRRNRTPEQRARINANHKVTEKWRRAPKLGSDGRISTRDWERLVERYNGLCAYCSVRPATDQDHVIPLSRGGRHTVGNVLPACRSCNSSKNDRLLIEWPGRPVIG